jgi:hypothetical protein
MTTTEITNAEQAAHIEREISKLGGFLLQRHWPEVLEIWAQSDDDIPSIVITQSIKLQGSVTAPRVTVKQSFSRKFSDEIAKQLNDPNQPEFETFQVNAKL